MRGAAPVEQVLTPNFPDSGYEIGTFLDAPYADVTTLPARRVQLS
ncbi:hypothetical protein [Saccharothrix deserti]|nr:hypothetical protein [Saccharothrix deserti]